ncbi:MAG: aminoacyl--tRNA ligase-related protein [Candidatus Thermoplasmatota archaeon]
MIFKLKALIRLSGKVEKESIEKIVNSANATILKKGSGKGKGANISNWKIDDEKLSFEINSDEYVRAHDALIRFRKLLDNELGKKFKVGVREIYGDEYRIEFEVEKIPKKEIKVPFVKEIKFADGKCFLLMEDINEEMLYEKYVDRLLSLIKDKINAQYYEGKEEYWELIWQSKEKKIFYNDDSSEEMLKRGWLKRGPSQGQFFYMPKATAIMRAMENIAIKEILDALGYDEIIAPKLTTFEIWEKTGHLSGVQPELYYVSPPQKREKEFWEYPTDLYKISKKAPVEEIQKRIKLPIGGLCYAQCPPFFWAFQGKTIPNDELPLLLYDRSGPSFRWESGGKHGIERVNEFHRIEIVFVGTPNQVGEAKDKLMDRFKYIFEEIMEIEWRIARVTPFYMQQAGELGLEEEKLKGTIDFEAYLPYKGREVWLEYQNLSIHGDRYTEAFNIKAQKGILWSGCSGIGLERWTAVFLSQKGFEKDNWPKKFREYMKECREIRFF